MNGPALRVGAVLLAAGCGARLGNRPKSLLQLDGVPLIRRLLSALTAAGVLWLPWVPSFRFQAAHTATPWTHPPEPWEAFDVVFVQAGGPVGHSCSSRGQRRRTCFVRRCAARGKALASAHRRGFTVRDAEVLSLRLQGG